MPSIFLMRETMSAVEREHGTMFIEPDNRQIIGDPMVRTYPHADARFMLSECCADFVCRCERVFDRP
jgi:hypothetical protein